MNNWAGVRTNVTTRNPNPHKYAIAYDIQALILNGGYVPIVKGKPKAYTINGETSLSESLKEAVRGYMDPEKL